MLVVEAALDPVEVVASVVNVVVEPVLSLGVDAVSLPEQPPISRARAAATKPSFAAGWPQALRWWNTFMGRRSSGEKG